MNVSFFRGVCGARVDNNEGGRLRPFQAIQDARPQDCLRICHVRTHQENRAGLIEIVVGVRATIRSK